ncbi:MAG: hypothetical protein Q7R98_01340 [Candidatus Jorgensenbacteria bacterium]|nr:hypothetical protein [Candidatus Jorgensenbacteria bacterium]
MLIAATLIAICALFYLLCKSADVVVTQIRSLGHRFGVPLSFLGIVLGLLTTLPELSIGVNAIIENIPSISIGNLLGGIMVIFGLIFGGSIILNREIATDGKIWHILPFFAYILVAMIMGLDGKFSETDGIILMVIYLGILFSLYEKYHKQELLKHMPTIHHHRISKHIVYIILGVTAVVVLAKAIISLSAELLKAFDVSIFVIGLIVFSIGTNLPEIIVTIRSWRRHIKELSTSSLIGSAIANPFMIGLLALLHPIYITVDFSYYLTMAFIALLFSAFLVFYKTNRQLTAREGVILIAIYVFFIISQFLYAF